MRVAAIARLVCACLIAQPLLLSQAISGGSAVLKTASKEGVRINYFVQGSGTVVVLLPSLGRSADDFDDIAERLVHEGYRVVRPQPRGIAGSVGPLEGLTLHDFADDVEMVIARESNEPVIIAGHAFGNWVARTLAADKPGAVRGVAILAAGTKLGNAPKDIVEAVTKSFDPLLPADERLGYLKRVFFAPGNDASVWLDLSHSSSVLAKAQFAAARATPESEWWGSGTATVLDLQAGDDILRPQSTKNEIRDDLGAARVKVVVIPNAGHALVPEQPAAVVEALVAWMKAL